MTMFFLGNAIHFASPFIISCAQDSEINFILFCMKGCMLINIKETYMSACH